jgi:hypothetical protein
MYIELVASVPIDTLNWLKKHNYADTIYRRGGLKFRSWMLYKITHNAFDNGFVHHLAVRTPQSCYKNDTGINELYSLS